MTVANSNTGIKREETTSASGNFSFPLDVGQCTVTAEMQGFKTETGVDHQITQGDTTLGSYPNYLVMEGSK